MEIATGREAGAGGNEVARQPVARQPPAPTCRRWISTELCDTGDGLARVSDTGTVVWSRTLQEIFAPYKVTPDSGWNILLIGDRYVGFLGTAGISDYLGPGELRKLDLSTLGITFALYGRSSTLQWSRPNTSVGCGAVEVTS